MWRMPRIAGPGPSLAGALVRFKSTSLGHPRVGQTPIPCPPPDEVIHYNPKVAPGEGGHHGRATVAGSGGRAYGWPKLNEIVHKPDGTYRPAYITHMRSMVKYSPQKMWYISSLVRGMSVDEALKQLEFVKLKGARVVEEVIGEAREMSLEAGVEFPSDMWVAESFCSQSAIVKGVRKHARLRVGTVKYRYVSYFVRLEEGKPPKHYYEHNRKKSPRELLEDFIKEHRSKRLHCD